LNPLQKNRLTFLVALLFFSFIYGQKIDNEVYKEKQRQAFELIFSNPVQAKKDIDAMFFDAGKVPDSLLGISYNNLGVFFGVTNQIDSSLFAFKKAIEFLPENHPKVPGIYNNQAIVYKKKGDYEAAFGMLEQALQKAKDHNNRITEAAIYGELASLYSEVEQFNNALENLLKSLKIYDSEPTSPLRNKMVEKQKLANLYIKLGEPKLAVVLYEEVIPFFKENNILDTYYFTLINYGNSLLQLDKVEEAEAAYKEGLEGLAIFQNTDFTIYAMERMAKLQAIKGNLAEAKILYKKVLEKAIANNSKRTLYITTDFGNLYLKENNPQAAIELQERLGNLEKQIFFATITGLEEQLNHAIFLAEVYKATGMPAKGMEALEQAMQLKDSLQKRTDIAAARELQSKYQSELQQQENLILKQDLQLQNRNYILIGSVLLLLVLLFGYFAMRFHLKSKLHTLALEKEAKERERLAMQIKMEQTAGVLKEKTIEKHKSELIASTFAKVKLDKQLQDILEEIKSSETHGVERKLKSLRAEDKYWDHIIEKFNQLNPNFYKDLKTTYPSLTKNDISFCSLVKLNLSNKEIARLLAISHESVITKKYRITKKLNLPADTDFYLWIQEIE